LAACLAFGLTIAILKHSHDKTMMYIMDETTRDNWAFETRH
jgi:hypothetical protein